MTLTAPAWAIGDALNSERFHHLYIHLPFCRHKCGYCDFNAYARLDGLMKPYVAALERELGWAAERFPFGPLSTVYFGGGTPSLLPAESISLRSESMALLSRSHKYFMRLFVHS